MKCKWIKKLTAGIIFLAAVGSLSGCQKAATAENLFRDIEVNMTSVESAEENQIVKLQMGDGDSAISQESNLDIEMIRDPAAVHRKGQQKTNMTGTKETQEMESYQVEEDEKTVIYSGTDEAWEKNAVEEKDEECLKRRSVPEECEVYKKIVREREVAKNKEKTEKPK